MLLVPSIVAGMRLGHVAVVTRRLFEAELRSDMIESAHRRKRPWSLRARLYALTFVVALPAVTYVAHDVVAVIESGFARARVELGAMARITAVDTTRFLTDSRLMLMRIVRRLSIAEARRGNCDVTFRDFSLMHAEFANIGLADRDGTMLCTSHGIADGKAVSILHRGWFRAVIDGSPFAVGEVMVDLVTDARAVAFGVPVHDPAGDLSGALGVSVSLEKFFPVTTAAPLTRGTVIAIVNADGRVISHSIEPQHLAGGDARDSMVVQTALAKKQGYARGAAFDPVERIWSFTRVEGADWIALVGLPVDEVLDEVMPEVKRKLVYAAAIVAILGFLAWYIGRSIERPVLAISRAARLVTAGELETRLAVQGPAEIEDVVAALNEMLDVRQKAEAAMREYEADLEARVSERTLELEKANARLRLYASDLARLGEVGDQFQASVTVEEVAATAAHFFRELSDAGGLFLLKASRNQLEALASWGELPPEEQVFKPEDCLALRRGKTSFAGDAQIRCTHAGSNGVSLCVPLVAQGETMGVLHLRGGRLQSAHGEAGNPELLGTMQTVAERTALAIANLRLRETLRAQSIRDGLTDLFNRRFLEETLDLQERVARRNGGTIGLMMLDVDHFKRFNDTYGHDAGDMVLRKIAALMRQYARGEDVACRYGGEELCLVMPGASPEITLERAEQIRDAVSALNLERGTGGLGKVTVSIGVGSFPQNGETWQLALRAADAALYRAKRAGRNRVELAS